MVAEVKFCGLTREEDVREAVRLGASYVGAIMTESARRVTPERAKELFAQRGEAPVRRVGVFGDEPAAEVIHAARTAGVDVVQLHGAAALESDFDRIRRELGVELWRVIRVGPTGLRSAPLRVRPGGRRAPRHLREGCVRWHGQHLQLAGGGRRMSRNAGRG